MLVSICMISYNGSRYITQQVSSILSQLGDGELIIVDDCSTDCTVEFIRRFNDNRINLHVNKSRLGIIGNMNKSLSLAKNDYVFLTDQDDIWNPNKIAKAQVAFELGADFVLTNAHIIDSTGQILKDLFWTTNPLERIFIQRLHKNPYLGCAMAFKRELLYFALPFPKKIPMHDIWIGNVAHVLGYKMVFIDEPLIDHRRHGKNASITSEVSTRPLVKKVSDRLIVVKELCKLLVKIKTMTANGGWHLFCK